MIIAVKLYQTSFSVFLTSKENTNSKNTCNKNAHKLKITSDKYNVYNNTLQVKCYAVRQLLNTTPLCYLNLIETTYLNLIDWTYILVIWRCPRAYETTYYNMCISWYYFIFISSQAYENNLCLQWKIHIFIHKHLF